jgi:hypothetical protein
MYVSGTNSLVAPLVDNTCPWPLSPPCEWKEVLQRRKSTQEAVQHDKLVHGISPLQLLAA